MWRRRPVGGRGGSSPSPGVTHPPPNTSPGLLHLGHEASCLDHLHAFPYRRSYALHSTLPTTLAAEIGYRKLNTLSVGIGSRCHRVPPSLLYRGGRPPGAPAWVEGAVGQAEVIGTTSDTAQVPGQLMM